MPRFYSSLRFILPAALVCAAVISPSAFAADAKVASAATVINIQKFAFSPSDITVKPGTTVAWVNLDETPHTVAAHDKSFVSKALDTNDRYERRFDTEGDFTYFCTLHPFMTGSIHVHK